jgi:hypothetical protein
VLANANGPVKPVKSGDSPRTDCVQVSATSGAEANRSSLVLVNARLAYVERAARFVRCGSLPPRMSLSLRLPVPLHRKHSHLIVMTQILTETIHKIHISREKAGRISVRYDTRSSVSSFSVIWKADYQGQARD